jgi:hypothetical protein
MAIVNCPECSKKLKVADASVGKKVKCTCGTVFVAEAADAPAAPSQVPPAAPSVAEKVLVACTECASKLKVAATSLGKKMKCPKCGGVFVAALPATALAEETMKRPAPAEDEEEPLHFADAESKDDDLEEEEDLPKPKVMPRKKQMDEEEEDEEDDAPEPAAKPVYPSRLWVNLFVLFLVIAYGAFFALTHPDISSPPLLDLGLVKPKATNPIPIRGGNQPDGPGQGDGKKIGMPPPFKGTGKKDKGKTADLKKDDAKKDDGKKDEPKDEKQGRLRERLGEPILMADAAPPTCLQRQRQDTGINRAFLT